MEIQEAQKQVDEWIKKFGVRYFGELTNLAILMEETGELSRLFARKYGEQSFKKESDQDVVDTRIKEELADIFFVLLCLSNQTDTDLNEELKKSLIKKSNRDASRHHENPKLKK